MHDIDRTKFPGLSENKLRVLSIFLTIDGEVTAPPFCQGQPSVFIRLGGCGVHCPWCDTGYSWSFNRGRDLTVEQIMGMVHQLVPPHAVRGNVKATVTGGEPLHQSGLVFNRLVNSLWNYLEAPVSIETSGTHDVGPLIAYRNSMRFPLSIIADYKMPSSGVLQGQVSKSILVDTDDRDAIKFVVASQEELEDAISVVNVIRNVYHNPGVRCFVSPVHGGELTPAAIFHYLKSCRGGWGLTSLGIGVNIQAHKYIFEESSEKAPSVRFRDEEDRGFDFTKEVPYNEGPQ